jgi:hypothetical protein
MTTLKPLFNALSAALFALATEGDTLRTSLSAAHNSSEEPHTDDAVKAAVSALLDRTAAISQAYEALAKSIDELGGSVDPIGLDQPVTSAWLRYEATFAHLMHARWLKEASSLWRDMADAIDAPQAA